MRFFISVLFSVLLLGPAPAHAQFGDPGGLGDILEDILNQGQSPAQQSTKALIDNIPVSLTISQTMDLTDHTLVISAYAPPERNGKFSKPRLLGETHLLLTGMSFPINAVIATPKPVTDTIDYSRIEAKILDPNGNPVRHQEKDGTFRGAEAVAIRLVDIGSYPIGRPEPAESIRGLEVIEGKVRLSDSPALSRGSLLTLQLVESDLAGGYSTMIAAETLIDIDQKTAPFDFTMERGVSADESKGKFALKAWITDWAGRKTHVMENPVPYNGPDRAYELNLDTYSMSPPPFSQTQPTAGQRTVSGEARFDAYKGLPAGSRLTATLTRGAGAPGMTSQLATKTVFLDGLSGNVKFDLVTESSSFDPYGAPPIISVRITGSQGRLFFSSTDRPVGDGLNIVQLTPSSAY